MITHTERMRVAWGDTDASGRIHYSSAFRYFEVAEHALMRKIFGAGGEPPLRGFGLPRVHVEADYEAALGFPDEFDCTARVAAVGRSSVTYGFEVARANGERCIAGRIVAVSIDAEGRAIALPPEFRKRLLEACGEGV